ncbi:MAG: glycerophosphodiester phosphodiesterase [Flavobacteriaceae bacterium TMED184]|nr:MAG: glycerophosphodiester phosphodiesterase [Flavobacteriaceae bacterium TMED184]
MPRLFFLIFIFLFVISCIDKSFPLIIGHRGAMGYVAENTIPSIEKAIELGVDGIEIDIFKCASGELVVFHDVMLDKLTDLTGKIEEKSLDSLKKAKVLGAYQIPTLNEVMNLIDGRLILNIELKGSETAIPTNDLLRDYFKKSSWNPSKIIISSFKWDELNLFYNLNKEVPIAVLTDGDPLAALPFARKVKAYAINPKYSLLTKTNSKIIKDEGIKLFPWTVNEIDDIKFMISLGVDGIITNFPDRVSKE